MRSTVLLAAAALMVAAPAGAEVKSAGPNGFEIEHRVQFVVPPEATYRAISQVPNWWSPDHTYSGDAGRLSLDVRAGGCFCERLDGGGGVEHMRVSYVEPGKRVVLSGALGPLLYEATAGVLDFRIEKVAGGSALVMNYRAAGFANSNAAKLAPVVDRVLGEQMKRLRVYATESNKRT